MITTNRKLILIVTAVILAIGLSVLFVVLGDGQRDRQLANARADVEQREFEKALGILETHLRTNPDDTDALLLASQTARRMESPVVAAKFLRSYEQYGGNYPDVLREERRSKAQSGDKQVADELMRVCEQSPGDAANFLDLEAIVRGFLPLFDRIEATRGRIEDGPDLQRAFKAADALLQTPMGAANRAEALFWSGRIHNIGTQYDRGVRDLREGLELAPTHFDLRLYLARTIVQATPEESLSHMEFLLRLRPGDVPVLFGIASLHRSLGHTSEAAKVLSGLLQDNPDDPQLLLEMALVELDSSRPVEAEVLLRRVANRTPDQREVLLALSKALRTQNRTNEADQYLKRAAELYALEERKKDSMKPKLK